MILSSFDILLACVPYIVEGLHREFLRAGADVMQAFTFYASDDKLDNRGNAANTKYTGSAINKRAAELAKKVADEGDALTLGGICQCPTYLSGASKEAVQEEFRKQIKVFVEAGLDFLLCEVTMRHGTYLALGIGFVLSSLNYRMLFLTI